MRTPHNLRSLVCKKLVETLTLDMNFGHHLLLFTAAYKKGKARAWDCQCRECLRFTSFVLTWPTWNASTKLNLEHRYSVSSCFLNYAGVSWTSPYLWTLGLLFHSKLDALTFSMAVWTLGLRTGSMRTRRMGTKRYQNWWSRKKTHLKLHKVWNAFASALW